MPSRTILLERRDAVAWITLNRPERLNSFNVGMHEELAEALSALADDRTVRVLVLTGAGRAFCAGQDLSCPTVAPDDGEAHLGALLERYYNPLIRRLTTFPIPVIGRIQGTAAGAGANLALACDIVVAARSAKFIQSFAHVGLLPDAGGTWMLPRLVGHARAMGLSLTGQAWTADEAVAAGLIWSAVDDGDLDPHVEALAQRLALGPTKAFAAIKQALAVSWLSSREAQLDYERDGQEVLGKSRDYCEGVAAFSEKRKPDFKGC